MHYENSETLRVKPEISVEISYFLTTNKLCASTLQNLGPTGIASCDVGVSCHYNTSQNMSAWGYISSGSQPLTYLA